MDQSLKSATQSALDDAFHAMFELSRTSAAWSQKPPAVT